MIECRIISVNPEPSPTDVPCEDYRHSKFVRRRRYVEKVLLPQMQRITVAKDFPAITPKHYTATDTTIRYHNETLAKGPGVPGNFLSHWCLWGWCVHIGVPVLILEDDALLPAEHEAGIVSGLGDVQQLRGPWILYLQSQVPYLENHIREYAPSQIQPLSPRLFKVVATDDLAGTASYAINPAAAQILIERAERLGTAPTDAFIHRAFNEGAINVAILGAWRLMFNLDEHWAEWNHVHQPEAV